ncbi:sensor domain-containing diguanylate cyclase [Marinicella rhabdoformis]|uniref:sensor domain-containing diguanylate cyclase n=1 Tax=Marinicella rhabdoformis TaxID=2580566 RepID=UPI0012AED306|nr:sensor domain-containing diguanylate cyclase [Marinicella rhabdoformis]
MNHSKQVKGVFFAVLLLVLAAIAVNIQVSSIQSAMRAFVDEEGNWAKAQRSAFQSFISFQHTKDDIHLEEFNRHLSFNKGMITAKKHLDNKAFDQAKSTLTAIGADSYNTDKIVYLSRYFSWLNQSQKAFAIWDNANILVVKLEQLVHDYSSESNPAIKTSILNNINSTQQNMLKAEKDFEQAFINLAKQTDTALSAITAIIFCLLGTVIFVFFKKTMNKITENDELYQATFNKSQLAYVQFKLNGDLIHANPQFLRLINGNHNAIKGLNFFEILRNQGNHGRLISIKNNRKHQDFEFKFSESKNQDSFYKAHTTLIHNYSGTPLYFVAAINDISKEKAQNSALKKLAHKDYLTGLLNKFAFEKHLTIALQNQTNGYLLYMDLNNFKAVNDQAGHQIGDRILENVSSRIKRQLRKDDPLARMGGDEFAVFLENTTLQRAIVIAKNIKDSVGSKPFTHQDNIFNVGVSIGISGLSHNDTSINELINHADQACYHSKSSNKVIVHESLRQRHSA